MQAMVAREALVAARKPALVAAALASAAVLAMFPAAWGVRGMPTMDGLAMYDQLLRLEWMLLVVLLPWSAARVASDERGTGLVRLCAMAAIQPSRMVAARLIAACAAMAIVVGAALPPVLTAREISGVALSRLLVDQAAMLAFALPVAVITVSWMHAADDRLRAWIAASATVLLAVAIARWALPTMAEAVIALVAIAAVGAAILVKDADRSCRYLSEDAA